MQRRIFNPPFSGPERDYILAMERSHGRLEEKVKRLLAMNDEMISSLNAVMEILDGYQRAGKKFKGKQLERVHPEEI